MTPTGFRWLTAEEWDASSHLWLMLHNAEQHTGAQRKLSLFGTGCCRRYWSFLLAESQDVLADFEDVVDQLPNLCAGDVRTAVDSLCQRADDAVGLVRPVDPSTDGLRLAAAKAVCYAVVGSA